MCQKMSVGEARVELGFSRDEVAEVLGVSESEYARIESGERALNEVMKSRLRDLFGESARIGG